MPGDAEISGRPADLVSSPAEKRAAARSLEQHLEPDTAKAGRWADEETVAAAKALADGWATASALRKVHDTWSDQVRNLLDRLGSERDALRAGNRVLTSADLATGSALRETSALDRY